MLFVSLVNIRPHRYAEWRDKLLTDARDVSHCWQCDFLAVRLSSSVNFLATIWPLIKILRSLVLSLTMPAAVARTI